MSSSLGVKLRELKGVLLKDYVMIADIIIILVHF